MFTAFILQVLAMVVVRMLRVGWIAVTLPIIVASKITAFRKFLLQFAGRGRIMESSTRVSNFVYKLNQFLIENNLKNFRASSC